MKPLWWPVSLALMAVVWLLSSSSAPLGIQLRHSLDWIAHTLEYLALGYALGRASGRRDLALVLALWFGAADEVHRAFVAGRDAGIQDWLWGLPGAWLGVRLGTRRALPPGGVQQPEQPMPGSLP